VPRYGRRMAIASQRTSALAEVLAGIDLAISAARNRHPTANVHDVLDGCHLRWERKPRSDPMLAGAFLTLNSFDRREPFTLNRRCEAAPKLLTLGRRPRSGPTGRGFCLRSAPPEPTHRAGV
jgi:hypothetical protein